MENTDLAAFIAFMVFLATQVTAIVEVIKQTLLKPLFLKKYEAQDENAVAPADTGSFIYARVVHAIAFAVGLLIAYIYSTLGADLNILGAFGFTLAVHPLVSVILTAFVISFGNEWVHVIFDTFKSVLETIQLNNLQTAGEIKALPAPVNPPANTSYPYTGNENVGASLLG